MKKVLIGLSGGVDSSVAAYLLKEQGYDVTGITLKMWSNSLLGEQSSESDNEKGIADAALIAEKLNIEHIILNCEKEFKEHVVDYFSNEYINGRTPNPCIECNKFIKFGFMLDYAKENGYDYIATGHYANIERDDKGRFVLSKSQCDAKDQTYFLYTLTQEQLSHTLMPLGNYSKDEIRKIALDKLGMYISEKPDSMEICFIPDDDYISFIKKYKNYIPEKGLFIDKGGNTLGTHSGIINFTIGQRKGLGIAFGKPMFVTGIDAATNNVTLGEKGSEFYTELIAGKTNFTTMDYPKKPFETTCKIRYCSPCVPCTVIPQDNDNIKVVFEQPQRAVTPGQSIVFYDDRTLLGGAVIKNVY